MKQKFILPVPPSVNHYLRRTRYGVTLTEKAREFKDIVRLTVHGKMMTGNIRMDVRYFRPRRAGDIDGPLKLVQDSLQGILYENDKQIVELHVYRFDDKDNPRIEVIVSNNLSFIG
jgi:crossover junction endodeoxyribonuclease RusA